MFKDWGEIIKFKKYTRVFCVFLLISVIFQLSVCNVFANNYLIWAYNPKLYTGMVSGDYKTAATNAMSAWNIAATNAPIPIRIVSTSNSNEAYDNGIIAYSGAYGLTGWVGLTHWRDYDYFNGNWYLISAYYEFNKSYADGYTLNEKKNIASHEMGHILGLDHSGSSSSVMYPTLTSVTGPTGYDEVYLYTKYAYY